MSATELVAAITAFDADRVFVARAIDPTLRADLSSSVEYEELPFVRGRTVVPPDLTPGDLVVAGHPNFLGVFDRPDVARWIAVTGRWSSLDERSPANAAVSIADPIPADVTGSLLESALELAKRLGQLPGVGVPFEPQCPVVVALLPFDPGLFGDALTGYPELPGGLRIELTPGVDTTQYAAELGDALELHSKETEHRWRQ